MRISLGRALIALGCLAAAPLACRGVLGIEEREFDPTLADGGGSGGSTADGGEDDLTCAFYCDTIMSRCAEAGKAQYATREGCLGLCSTFLKGSLADTSGNTLGCRVQVAKTAVEAADCAAAGPGGNGVCGDNCESFCASALEICPGDFASKADCLAACGMLPSCGTYSFDGGTPNDPSIQCRLFHLTSAAVGQPSNGVTTQAQTTHCPHVGGVNECVLPDGGATCP